MSSSSRPVYSFTQLDQYFSHINFKRPRISAEDAKGPAGLDYLTSLQKHQMAAIPFSNLSIHYSKTPNISIDPKDLYHKIVERGHGGYCMENNGFFGTVLRSLGFELFSAGARVCVPDAESGGDQFGGWAHMVNIVAINGTRYMVDVGFGAQGPTQPLPLVDGKVSAGIGPASLRVLWTNIPPNTDPGQRLWVYQYRINDDSPWTTAYCFTELEFLPQDYTMMNYWTSTARTSLFTHKVICTKTIVDDEEEVVGSLILVGREFKRRVKGEKEILMICENEQQRIEGLKKWFGAEFTEDEQQGIMGTVTQLTPEAKHNSVVHNEI
ncbi:MAG: N-terminal acetyltransferase [Peltula sp. TS41687]|nr:MAG: N-terminal acetyltransferase [Peltula sp. TS41687]